MGAKTNAILLCLFGVAWTRKDAKIPYYRSLLTLYLFRYSFLVAHVSTSSSIFSSFMQQAHSKDLALRPCCHLGELSHDFYWNLTFSHAKKAFPRSGWASGRRLCWDQPPRLSLMSIRPESWGFWVSDHLIKIFICL